MAAESEESQTHKPSNSISSTNWIVSSGSLTDSISFETPISSPIDDEHQQDSNSLKRLPVLLNPNSSDSSPCEIKLAFEQRHEIRQVYVRSTARVFEIYYESGPRSGNEYLCTVRCGIAAREDAPFSTSDIDPTTLRHSEGSIVRKEIAKDKIKNDSNSNSDEDGWVEIKNPDSPFLDRETCSVARNIDRNTGRSNQDFYEATAQITDSNPCISLTLRLLSLHTKGCVYLEEIYIFGESVGPVDSDDKSAESSMMAMLVPTLMQLSKTGMLKRTQDKHVSGARQESNRQDNESFGPYVERATQKESMTSLPNQKEIYTEAAAKACPESTGLPSDVPVQVTGQGPRLVNHINDLPPSRMEGVLDQLVCRVGRIEAFCSRFEENMLKPISNIETRLGRVEQKLEELTLSSQSSKLYSCERFIAPNFSCIGTETSSLQKDENENNFSGMPDFTSKGSNFSAPLECNGAVYKSRSPLNDRIADNCRMEPGSFLNNDTSDSTAAPQLFPSLVITAPEFPSEDDDDEDDCHGGVGSGGDKDSVDDFVSSKMDCPVNKPSLSLDDALTMALAGFMSSTSAQHPRINHSWKLEAPEFTDESNGGNDNAISQDRNLCQQNLESSSYYAQFAGTQNFENLNSTSDSSQDEARVMRLTTVGSAEAVIRGCASQEEVADGSCGEKSVNQIVSGDCLLPEEGTDGSCGDQSVNQTIAGDSDEVEGGVDNYNREDTTDGFTTLNNNVRVMRLPGVSSAEAVIRGCPLQEEGTDGGYGDNSVNQFISGKSDEITGEVNSYRMEDTINGLATLNMDSNLTLSLNGEDVQNWLVLNPGHNEDDVVTMLGQNFTSTVDFELPVLDVKFAPHRHLSSRCSLETLLSCTSENEVETSCAENISGDGSVTGQSQLLVEDDFLIEIGNIEDITVNARILDHHFNAWENEVEDVCDKDNTGDGLVTGQSELLLEEELLVKIANVEDITVNSRAQNNCSETSGREEDDSCAKDKNRDDVVIRQSQLPLEDKLVVETGDFINVSGNSRVPDNLDASEREGEHSCAKDNSGDCVVNRQMKLQLEDELLVEIGNVEDITVSSGVQNSHNDAASGNEEDDSYAKDKNSEDVVTRQSQLPLEDELLVETDDLINVSVNSRIPDNLDASENEGEDSCAKDNNGDCVVTPQMQFQLEDESPVHVNNVEASSELLALIS